MNEWQDLDLENLPPDILVEGTWEIEWLDPRYCEEWRPNDSTDLAVDTIRTQLKGHYLHRIRRPEGWEPKECRVGGGSMILEDAG